MVDLETHRIIDLIDSRETKEVEAWLKTYPSLEVISRDGAQTYSSVASGSHPEAIQVSGPVPFAEKPVRGSGNVYEKPVPIPAANTGLIQKPGDRGAP